MNEKSELISVIIPIYNVEKYLEKCLNSVITQTYYNLEIILVNDGSTDNSIDICNKYAEKDDRIILINKKNGGLSDARNYGIDRANGVYLAFIDSDDYVEKEYIEKLYNAIKKTKALISQCSIKKIENTGNIVDKYFYSAECKIDSIDWLKDLYRNHKVENIVVWNKLYHKSLFFDLRFPKGKIHEDEFVTYKIVANVNFVTIINDFLYNYRLNSDGIMKSKFSEKKIDYIDSLNERVLYFEKMNNKFLYMHALLDLIQSTREYYINVKKYINYNKEVKKKLIRIYRKNYKNLIKIKDISFIKKFKLLFFYCFPNIYYFIKK